MYAELEKSSPKLLDSFVNSLSWKGDPRRGWLAVGNSRGVVGVTYTESAEADADSWSDADGSELEKQCLRRNFNFTEHSQEITLVRWNKSLDKIATCDAAGSVIVWKNHNGRSIMELVNNRGVSIADFQWSNDGTRVLISYVDGYVLLGTAFGRRLWARQLSIGSFVTNPASQSQQSRLLSSTWSPDDSKVVVGSSIGELIELDVENGGSLVSTTEVLPGIGIIGLQWVKSPANSKSTSPSSPNTRDRLSLYLRNGKVVLMSSCGDQQATIIRTGLLDGQMQWNESGSILAVAGYRKSQGVSTVRFFKPTGQLLFTLPLNTKDPIGAMSWGHVGRHLFVAARNQLFTVNVHQTIPSLQYLCQSAIAMNLKDKESTYDLHLPTKMKTSIVDSYSQIIQGHIPDYRNLLGYVSRPPPPGHRVFCTVAPNPTPSSPSSRNRHINSYTLYVEHLGSLYPILTAHKSGKIRQCFTLSLPGDDSLTNQNNSYVVMSNGADGLSASVEGINSSVDLGASQSYEDSTMVPLGVDFSSSLPVDASFHRNSCCRITDALFSTNGDDGQILAAVTSNVMASKFKIQGLSDNLESDLGSIAIKTSFLHIQPRKVTVLLPRQELNDSGIESDSGDSGSDDEYDNVFSELPEYLIDHHPVESAPLEFDIGKHTITSSKRVSSSIESPIIVMSKTPTWNEQHMIYQLDFGGRVTAKSAKNFQLEVDNKQVLQFGRIDNGAFILDFQAPFSPIQAFATALANLV